MLFRSEDKHSILNRNTTHTIATQKAELVTLRRQVEVLAEEVDEFRQIADQKSHALEELQEQLDDLSTTQANTSRREVEDESWTVVREELHRQANHVRTIEAANAKMSGELAILKQRHANIEVLKEQKRELERKVGVVEELREKVVKLEAELEAARKEREAWYVRHLMLVITRFNGLLQGIETRRAVKHTCVRHTEPVQPTTYIRSFTRRPWRKHGSTAYTRSRDCRARGSGPRRAANHREAPARAKPREGEGGTARQSCAAR